MGMGEDRSIFNTELTSSRWVVEISVITNQLLLLLRSFWSSRNKTTRIIVIVRVLVITSWAGCLITCFGFTELSNYESSQLLSSRDSFLKELGKLRRAARLLGVEQRSFRRKTRHTAAVLGWRFSWLDTRCSLRKFRRIQYNEMK
jgi:hypothetical protein